MKIKPEYLRHSFLSLAILAASQLTYAQNANLKEKKIALNDNAKIVYHVKDNNVKEGSYYIKSSKNDQLIVKGAYTDDKRSGNWYFYDEAGKPETVYSFQQNKLAFIDSSLVNKLTINLPGQDKEVVENTQIPVLLSSMNLFLSEMSNNIVIPEDHFVRNEALPIQIKSVVDTDGEARYSVIYKHNKKTYEQPVKLTRSQFDIQWMPALYNKKPIKAEVIINTEISGSTEDGNNFRRFRWGDKQ